MSFLSEFRRRNVIRVFDVIRVYTNPSFRNLHADPGWHSVLERIGRSPEPIAAIKFKVPLPE
jgi:hypothetical protein